MLSGKKLVKQLASLDQVITITIASFGLTQRLDSLSIISFYLWWVLPDGIEYMNILVLESKSKLTNPTLNHAAKSHKYHTWHAKPNNAKNNQT
jgi:uncharacterized membrane protein YcaP (DUF421 family)